MAEPELGAEISDPRASNRATDLDKLKKRSQTRPLPSFSLSRRFNGPDRH